MKINLLSSMLALLMGSVVTVGGVSMHAEKILANAQDAVNGANLHQLATVIEIYYADQGYYPNVHGGKELIDTLKDGHYLMSVPLNPSEFRYEVKDNGQDYSLAVADQ